MGTVAIIISIAASLVAAGLSINSAVLASRNQGLRGEIQSFMGKINGELSAGRLSIDKMLSLLNTRNQNALAAYLMNNPVIGSAAKALQANSEKIAEFQVEYNNLERDLTNLYSELSSLGYSQSNMGATEEDARARDIRSKIEKKKKEQADLSDRIAKFSAGFSTVPMMKTSDDDLTARSQNINGGLINNG